MLVKLEWLAHHMVKKLWRYVKPFSSDTGKSRTDRQNGRMDRQTDRIAISISRVSVLTCDKNESLSQSPNHWLAFRNIRFSKCLSVSSVLLCDMISPAQLTSISATALAGNSALSFMNNFFSSGQAAILDVLISSDVESRHWSSALCGDNLCFVRKNENTVLENYL